jgi:hypothetical protein
MQVCVKKLLKQWHISFFKVYWKIKTCHLE